MSKAAGLVLILAGLGVGTFGLAQSDDAGPQAAAAQSPASGALARGAVLKGGVAPVPQHAALALRFSSPVVTIVTRRMGEPRTPPERFAIPKGRDALARELQKELRRVGCYEGEISGIWSPSTRRAMSAFIERMNARLPIEEPDAVLFAMVKGQHETVCGKACPAGEAQSADGRCVPPFLLAQAKSKPRPASVTTAAIEKPAAAIVGWLPSATPPSVDPPMTDAASKQAAPQFAGRMGLAGPPVRPTLAPTLAPPLAPALASALAPPLGTTPRAPRYRATHAGASAVHPRVGQGGQRWSSAIFSQKMSNN
jgi:peptidoglycan hydrolase-like protein with peptidoglycan-binding domain